MMAASKREGFTQTLNPDDLVSADVPPMHFCGGATPTYRATRTALDWESQEVADGTALEPVSAEHPHP